jgi:hypothetical protein
LLGPSCDTDAVADQRRSPRPTADPVVISTGNLPAALRAWLPEIRVPTYVFRFEGDAEATLTTSPDGRELVAFAHAVFGLLCLDPAIGHVVDMVVMPDQTIVRGPSMVNSSLAQFVATTTEAIRRFPFYGGDAEMDECTRAADILREQLVHIDPPAWETDSYWDTLYWDIGMCDFSPDFFDPPGGLENAGAAIF